MAKLFRYEHDYPVVGTTGGRVHGYEYDGVVIFKGIPYARAERFQDPHPVSWDGVLEATNYSYACPVIEPPSLDKSIDFARRGEVKNEACQNLNVWTPGIDGEKRPVMVWLHGGGMSFGSGSEDDLCQGEELARYGGVVAVTINHRLNLLGFCDLSAYGEKYRNSGNQSIADMVAALTWVRDNIASFGGDPDNVTIFGQSGGGMKVTALLQTPAADGLYHRGIVMSGVQGGAMCDSIGSGKEMAEFLMKETGTKSADELASIPVEELMKAARYLRRTLKFRIPNTGEGPLRGDYYLGDPRECPFRPETADIPLLVGSTFGEFNAPRSYAYARHSMTREEMLGRIREEFGEELGSELVPMFEKAWPDRPVVDLVSMDVMFRSYILEYLERRTALNNCTWSYIFNQDMPMLGGVSPLHGNDLGFVFHTTDRAPALQEPGVTEKVQEMVFSTVMAFVRTGNPNNSSIPDWKPSKPGEMNNMIFDLHPGVRVNHDRELNARLTEALLRKEEHFMYEAVSGRLG